MSNPYLRGAFLIGELEKTAENAWTQHPIDPRLYNNKRVAEARAARNATMDRLRELQSANDAQLKTLSQKYDTLKYYGTVTSQGTLDRLKEQLKGLRAKQANLSYALKGLTNNSLEMNKYNPATGEYRVDDDASLLLGRNISDDPNADVYRQARDAQIASSTQADAEQLARSVDNAKYNADVVNSSRPSEEVARGAAAMGAPVPQFAGPVTADASVSYPGLEAYANNSKAIPYAEGYAPDPGSEYEDIATYPDPSEKQRNAALPENTAPQLADTAGSSALDKELGRYVNTPIPAPADVSSSNVPSYDGMMPTPIPAGHGIESASTPIPEPLSVDERIAQNGSIAILPPNRGAMPQPPEMVAGAPLGGDNLGLTMTDAIPAIPTNYDTPETSVASAPSSGPASPNQTYQDYMRAQESSAPEELKPPAAPAHGIESASTPIPEPPSVAQRMNNGEYTKPPKSSRTVATSSSAPAPAMSAENTYRQAMNSGKGRQVSGGNDGPRITANQEPIYNEKGEVIRYQNKPLAHTQVMNDDSIAKHNALVASINRQKEARRVAALPKPKPGPTLAQQREKRIADQYYKNKAMKDKAYNAKYSSPSYDALTANHKKYVASLGLPKTPASNGGYDNSVKPALGTQPEQAMAGNKKRYGNKPSS